MIEAKTEGTFLVCSLRQEITATTVPVLRDKFVEFLQGEADWEEMVLDCRNVETIDSIGVNLVVGLFKQTRTLKRSFRMTGCNPTVLKIVKLFRLDDQFIVEAEK